MDDKQLRQAIMDELEFDPRIEAANIGVAVDDGIVTLSGHVSSYVEKVAAEKAARRVKGVRALAEELAVRYPSDKKTADDEIAKRAVKILEWYDLVPQHALQVTVQRGWIVLSGDVMWQYQRKAAENAVRKLSGIEGVVNNIVIRPAVYPSDVKKRIEDALSRHAEIEARDIRVTVREGKVSLDGKVDSLEERHAVENAAWSVAGVRSVDDRLMIER
jgi:osmotically-inducible protein OsmY